MVKAVEAVEAVEAATRTGRVAMEVDVIAAVATEVATIVAEAVGHVVVGMTAVEVPAGVDVITGAEVREVEAIAGAVETIAVVRPKRSRSRGSKLRSNQLRPPWPGWLNCSGKRCGLILWQIWPR